MNLTFNLGDRVRLKVSGREGTISSIDEPNFAPGSNGLYSYLVELEGGAGTSTVWETGLEYVGGRFWEPKCECGVSSTRSGGRHSSYCPKAGETE